MTLAIVGVAAAGHSNPSTTSTSTQFMLCQK